MQLHYLNRNCITKSYVGERAVGYVSFAPFSKVLGVGTLVRHKLVKVGELYRSRHT